MLKEEKTGSGICHETPPQRHKIIILFFHTTIRQMACRSDLYSYEVSRKLSFSVKCQLLVTDRSCEKRDSSERDHLHYCEYVLT